MKFMDINGIWINVVNLVITCTINLHLGMAGMVFPGEITQFSWWNHPSWVPNNDGDTNVAEVIGGAEAAACNDPEMGDFLDSRNVFDVSKRVKKYLV
jgi:hypothetical protein